MTIGVRKKESSYGCQKQKKAYTCGRKLCICTKNNHNKYGNTT